MWHHLQLPPVVLVDKSTVQHVAVGNGCTLCYAAASVKDIIPSALESSLSHSFAYTHLHKCKRSTDKDSLPDTSASFIPSVVLEVWSSASLRGFRNKYIPVVGNFTSSRPIAIFETSTPFSIICFICKH